MTATRVRTAAALATTLAVLLAVTACSSQPSYAYSESIDAPAQPTAPGTELEVGEAAHLLAGPEQPMAVVVRDVLYGDDTYYDDFDNGDEFVGNTPVFVIVEQHALYEIEDPNAVLPLADLFMTMDDGEQPDSLSVENFGGPACPVTTPGYRSAVGKDLRCTVYLLPEGRSLATLGWYGTIYEALEEPVVWRIPAESTALG